MNSVGEWKQRSDKKRDIKPTISIELKETIYHLSDFTKIPVKDVCQYMTMLVLRDRKSIEQLSQFFQRDLWLGNTLFLGTLLNKSVSKHAQENSGRVTIGFSKQEYEAIVLLRNALD